MPYYYKREINDLSGTGKKVFRYEIRSEDVATLDDLAAEIHKRYRALVHVSRAVASRDLQDFVHDPAVPITTDGIRSHKIYVAAR